MTTCHKNEVKEKLQSMISSDNSQFLLYGCLEEEDNETK